MPIQKPKFELEQEYVQLALELEVETLEMEAQGGVSPEEARRRSEKALMALKALKGAPLSPSGDISPNTENADLGGESGEPAWFKNFEMLMEIGWPWRYAAYIAWASLPTDKREPKTQDELAIQHLGLTSDRAISTWRRKNPAIDQFVAIMQSAPLWEHRADFFDQLIIGMKKAGDDYKFFNHLKMYGEMTGDYIPLTQLAAVLKRKGEGDLPSVSEEDLGAELEEIAEELNPLRPGPEAPTLTANVGASPKAPLSADADIPPNASHSGGEEAEEGE